MADDPELPDDDLVDDAESPGSSPGFYDLVVSEPETGMRLDRFIATRLAGLSRVRVQALIRDGKVEGPAGPLLDAGSKVKRDQQIRIVVPPAKPATPLGEEVALTIVYEDKHLLVIDKPAGMVVHPGAGHGQGTLVNALIAHCGDDLSGIGGVKRPGIVHRLDKDTSGLLVVAKTDAAHRGLSEQFASHGADGRLTRTYEALVWGAPIRKTGTVDANLGRSHINRTRMAVMRSNIGRRAVTHYEVVETFDDAEGKPLAARLRVALETGRTHQIRVHLAHIGHPVMGDTTYGAGFKSSANRLSEPAAAALEALARQALHAEVLGFVHPVTENVLEFTSARPSDIQTLLDGLTTPVVKPAGRTKRAAKPKMSKP